MGNHISKTSHPIYFWSFATRNFRHAITRGKGDLRHDTSVFRSLTCQYVWKLKYLQPVSCWISSISSCCRREDVLEPIIDYFEVYFFPKNYWSYSALEQTRLSSYRWPTNVWHAKANKKPRILVSNKSNFKQNFSRLSSSF